MTKTSGSRETILTRWQFLKAVGAFGVVAGSGGVTAGGGGQGGSSEPVGLSVSHWPTLLYSVPWAVAIEQGYFEERGITLDEIVGSSGGGETVRNVVTGGLPLGAVATPAAINAFNEGSELKILGGAIANTADISFVTLPDRGIESIEDVRGKSVGFTEPGSITQGCAVLSLQAAGIDPDEVELQAMGGLSEAITGLKGHRPGTAVVADGDPPERGGGFDHRLPDHRVRRGVRAARHDGDEPDRAAEP